MYHRTLRMHFILLATLCLTTSAVADPRPVTKAERRVVVEAVVDIVERDYVDGEKGRLVGAALTEGLAEGRYDALSQPSAFAAELTRELLELTGDLHFSVGLDPEWIEAEARRHEPEIAAAARQKELELDRRRNFGFRDLRVLEGNVGYLNLTYFADPETAHDNVVAVMRYFAHCDAMILDLRFNNGGYLEMAQLLLSYFLSTTPSQVLFDYHDLEDGRRVERRQWVLPSVSGKRRPELPLYVLTSSTSFSAAEWMAFILKNLERATLIGERTAGGAHPVNPRALNERFVIRVPTGEIKDGVLGRDFEGQGVEPMVEVAASKALATAHHAALQHLMETSEDEAPAWYLPIVEARLDPVTPTRVWLDAVAGYYGRRQVIAEAGALFYSWGEEGRRVPLHVLANGILALEGIDDFRFRVVVEDDRVVGLERLFQDGRRLLHPRTPTPSRDTVN